MKLGYPKSNIWIFFQGTLRQIFLTDDLNFVIKTYLNLTTWNMLKNYGWLISVLKLIIKGLLLLVLECAREPCVIWWHEWRKWAQTALFFQIEGRVRALLKLPSLPSATGTRQTIDYTWQRPCRVLHSASYNRQNLADKDYFAECFLSFARQTFAVCRFCLRLKKSVANQGWQ